MDQLYTLSRVLEGSWELFRRLLREYGVLDPFIGAVRSLYDHCKSLVSIAGSKSDVFPVRVGLRQSCPLSPIPFIIFMDIIFMDIIFMERR